MQGGVGLGGSCSGVDQTWLRYLTAPPVGHYKGKHDYKMHIYHDHKKILHTTTTKQGLGTSRGQNHVLPLTWGVEALGAPVW